MNEAAQTPQRTVSTARKSRWPGWIWAVPVAAAGIVIWLVVRQLSVRGFDVTVSFEDVTGVKEKSTQVLYRGVQIGQVSEISLSKDRKHAELRLDIHDSVKGLVNAGTRFYLRGAQPSLSDPSSLKAILSGPTIVMVPGAGSPQRQFNGIASNPLKLLSVSVPYLARFGNAVGDLKPGAPVMLRGFRVGQVDQVALATDAASGTLGTAILLSLDPTCFHIEGGPPADDNWTSLMNATLAKLVHRNLRARLTKDPPLIGASQVELEVVPDAAPAVLRTGGEYPEIPSIEDGGIGELTSKLGELPIHEIGRNVRVITERIKRLASSPQLNDSMAHLDHTLALMDKTMQKAEPQVGPTLASVHQAVDDMRTAAGKIDSTAVEAQKVIGGGPLSSDGNVERALRELSGAARSLRTLADYLDQHPEALIKGRAGDEAAK